MCMFDSLIRLAVSGAATATLFATTLYIASPAMAAEGRAPTVRVPTKGLDLSTPSGRFSLRARVHRAARRACSYPGEPRYTESLASEQRCITDTIAQAEPQVALAMSRWSAQRVVLNQPPVRSAQP